MSGNVKAITFDLWDTIIDDDSDEPKRLKFGLRSKSDERFHLLFNLLNQYNEVTEEQIKLGVALVDAAFLRCWRDYSITWTYRVRVEILLKGLALTLPENELQMLINLVGRMELEILPNPIEGIKEVLVELSSKYKLCIVSDTIYTPGEGLRDLLKLHGLERYFSGFTFSDEVGHSKPHIDMFASASQQMGCKINEMIHIGDRNHNDIAGPQALGMKAILFVGKRDIDKACTSADAICERHSDLPIIIQRLVANQ